ncbi:hypothetical protein D3C72_1962970 [compost metagenome]
MAISTAVSPFAVFFNCRPVDYKMALKHQFFPDICKHVHFGLAVPACKRTHLRFGNTFLAQPHHTHKTDIGGSSQGNLIIDHGNCQRISLGKYIVAAGYPVSGEHMLLTDFEYGNAAAVQLQIDNITNYFIRRQRTHLIV